MRTSSTLVFLSACLFGIVKTAPSYEAPSYQSGHKSESKSCSVAKDKIPLPTGQTTLTVPTGVTPEFIAAGFGTQNYSCSAAGTFTSIGALAELFDASCVFDAFQSACSKKASSAEETQASMRAALGPNPTLLGHHYFVNNPVPGGTGLSPTFDFRADSEKGNPNAFVITSKIGDIPAPTDPTQNVDWLELMAIPGQGSLAKNVFRILTIGGQPPSSCTPGSAPITVPYAASYWFFN
ncbi:hypothetical protein K439DRAFT_1004890 [Ramaria rubella]|nr:hypothetical protein K439DRAFT_1004890 [Ramaria rubella]